MLFSLKNGGGQAEDLIGGVRPAEAEDPLEVGGGGDAGQAVQRHAVQVVATARCPCSPQSSTLCVSRWSV